MPSHFTASVSTYTRYKTITSVKTQTFFSELEMSMGSQKSDQTLEHKYTSEKHKKSP